MDRLLTLSEMAYRLNVSPHSLRRHVKKENIPFEGNLKEMMFDYHSVLAHLDPQNILKGYDVPRHDHPGGSVYLLHADNSFFYKIGYSLSGIHRRLTQLQSGCPYDLVLRATRAGDVSDERRLHSYFCKYRLYGRAEWFEVKHLHWSVVAKAFLEWDESLGRDAEWLK